MKKLAVVIFLPILLISLFLVSIGFLHPDVNVKYNGNIVSFQDSKPDVYAGGSSLRIVAPIDVLAAKLGASVEFEPQEQTLTVKKDDNTIVFYNKNKTALVNGKEKSMFVESEAREGHFYASVRFLGENLGKAVFWESKTNSINIYDIENNSPDTDKKVKSCISADKFTVKSENIVFKIQDKNTGSFTEYLPDVKLNPNINKQVYNVVRYLTDSSYYTSVYYDKSNDSDAKNPPAVTIAISPSLSDAQNQQFYLKLELFDKTSVNPRKLWNKKEFDTNAFARLELFKLERDGEANEVYKADPLFDQKLKLTMIGLFGENTGLGVYEYLNEEYTSAVENQEVGNGNYTKTRRFDNIRVDIAYSEEESHDRCIYVYFSYQK